MILFFRFHRLGFLFGKKSLRNTDLKCRVLMCNIYDIAPTQRNLLICLRTTTGRTDTAAGRVTRLRDSQPNNQGSISRRTRTISGAQQPPYSTCKFFPRIKRPGHNADILHRSTIGVSERVELHSQFPILLYERTQGQVLGKHILVHNMKPG
jgi:hypothetical protein